MRRSLGSRPHRRAVAPPPATDGPAIIGFACDRGTGAGGPVYESTPKAAFLAAKLLKTPSTAPEDLTF
jgi:hypothetical protein